jgi:hypothetical protein
MSQKRKLDQVAEVESADASDASSASATKKSRPHAKKHKRPSANKDDGYGASANALKSRIRDLKRLLAHVENVPKHKMSAGARIERERELEACEHELAEKTMKARESEHRKKMIGKYHQVRFFGMSAEFPCLHEDTNANRSTKGNSCTQASQERAGGGGR